MALGDLNGDGIVDVFSVRSYASDAVHLGDSEGNLVWTGQAMAEYGAFAVELFDIDADGDLDAVVANNFGGVRIWQNDGAAFFTDIGVISGFRYRDVAIGDIDGDGVADIVAARTGGTNDTQGGLQFALAQSGGGYLVETHQPSQGRCQSNLTVPGSGESLIYGQAQSLQIFQLIARDHPPRRDDVCPVSAFAAER